MSTARTTTTPTSRRPLRIDLATPEPSHGLGGAWWPQSRDLAVELADLVDHFPAGRSRIDRVLFSPPDWDASPRRVPVARGYVKAGSFPRDDTHELQLRTADRRTLRLLVVPPGYDEGQGAAAMRAALDPSYDGNVTTLLREAEGHPDPDPAPADHWSDDGGSFRRGA